MDYAEKNILITGGSGSWGQELTSQLLALPTPPKKIRIISRNELNQVNMERNFASPILDFRIADVREADEMRWACEGIDYVFHLAALKHVPVCERQPIEAVKTNIQGTINLINASRENEVKVTTLVSTDKAVSPHNLYGMTKGVAEKLVIQANNRADKTRFVCIRGGNVLGSNGSVVPLFISQIKKNNEITITDDTMTRFYLTLPEAIGLIFRAVELAQGGEIFVMKMPACALKDLAEVIVDKVGNEATTIRSIGVRPGEKIHEVLVSKQEAPNTFEVDRNYYVILPETQIDGLNKSQWQKLSQMEFDEFSSNYARMTKPEIERMLIEGGFLS